MQRMACIPGHKTRRAYKTACEILQASTKKQIQSQYSGGKDNFVGTSFQIAAQIPAQTPYCSVHYHHSSPPIRPWCPLSKPRVYFKRNSFQEIAGMHCHQRARLTGLQKWKIYSFQETTCHIEENALFPIALYGTGGLEFDLWKFFSLPLTYLDYLAWKILGYNPCCKGMKIKTNS